MQLFALFKEKQMPPAVQVRSRLFAGEDLIFDLRSVPAGRTLLFRVYDPAGKEKPAASRSVNTGKETNFRFRIPFNAMEGLWTFQCTDMASGLHTEKKITIEKRK